MDTHDTSYHSTEENLTETMKTIFPIHILRLIQQISELAGKEGFSVYLVGGIVRDLILGLTNVDIDLVVDGDGLSFGEQPRPFAGWLILVEDAPGSRSEVQCTSPHFPVFKEFENTSYLKRYDILCQKLVREQLYTTASVIASPREAVDNGSYSQISDMTNIRSFVSSLAGHIAATAARLG
jgi:hypothetical protein